MIPLQIRKILEMGLHGLLNYKYMLEEIEDKIIRNNEMMFELNQYSLVSDKIKLKNKKTQGGMNEVIQIEKYEKLERRIFNHKL